MVGKGKKEVQGLHMEHMNTKIIIKNHNTCATCPYRIYAKDNETVTLGIGNINSDFIFILPTYDFKAKIGYDSILELLSVEYEKAMGKSVFDDAYITRLVKCHKSTTHNLYESCITNCSTFLFYELNKLDARNVVFFGSAYDDYISKANIVGHNIPIKKVFKSHSPGVLYYNNLSLTTKFFTNLNNIINPPYDSF